MEAIDDSPIMQGTEADKAADYANYFCSYSYLYHQKQMLMDHVRMQAYYTAIMKNSALFQGKVVLDVGTGSGVLSIWAAKAGAAKVFAVEYTDMAKHAKNLVEKNGLSGVVEVIQSSVEDLDLPCQVDIIISEWMGYILLRESMLDSVIRARKKWLKPDGCMFPSHATMYWAPISFETDRLIKHDEFVNSMNEWDNFSSEMDRFYGIDMSALSESYKNEQEDYYIFSSLWTELKREHIIGQPYIIKQLDLNVCTMQDAECVHQTYFETSIPFPVRVSGFAGWFTVDFNGSIATPAMSRVVLSTGPEAGFTHWGQQVFYLKEPLDCSTASKVHGTVSMIRQMKNKRLYELNLELKVDDNDVSTGKYEIP